MRKLPKSRNALILIPLLCASLVITGCGRGVIRAQKRDGGSIQLSPQLNNYLKHQSWGMMSVSRGDGVFLKLVAHMINAQNALEIGTYHGYSAIWIGSALKRTGGRLTTLEIDHESVLMARKHFKNTGLDRVITVIEGDALKTLPALAGPFDLVFIDARKSDYVNYFKIIYPKLKKGGVIIAHNAILQSGKLRDYLSMVKNHPNLDTVIISTNMLDGMAVSVKIKMGL